MAKMTIKRIGVFSLAKLQGVILAVLGLVIGIPLGLLMMIFGAAMMTQGGEAAAGGGVGLGLGLFYMIMLPVMYGVMGFVFGAITALVYNVASGFILHRRSGIRDGERHDRIRRAAPAPAMERQHIPVRKSALLRASMKAEGGRLKESYSSLRARLSSFRLPPSYLLFIRDEKA
jgi:hypothetical protein